jgi:hypothetical protein
MAVIPHSGSAYLFVQSRHVFCFSRQIRPVIPWSRGVAMEAVFGGADVLIPPTILPRLQRWASFFTPA